MTLKFKNTSSAKELFGLTGGFGAFVNNAAIKNNPELLKILATKDSRRSFKKHKIRVATKSNIHNINFRISQSKAKKEKTKTPPTQTSINSGTTVFEAIKKQENIPLQKFATFKWRYDAKNRYYNIYIQPNLIGGYSLIRSWGSIGTHLGHYKTMLFDSLESLYQELAKFKKQRKYKGYKLLSSKT